MICLSALIIMYGNILIYDQDSLIPIGSRDSILEMLGPIVTSLVLVSLFIAFSFSRIQPLMKESSTTLNIVLVPVLIFVTGFYLNMFLSSQGDVPVDIVLSTGRDFLSMVLYLLGEFIVLPMIVGFILGRVANKVL